MEMEKTTNLEGKLKELKIKPFLVEDAKDLPHILERMEHKVWTTITDVYVIDDKAEIAFVTIATVDWIVCKDYRPNWDYTSKGAFTEGWFAVVRNDTGSPREVVGMQLLSKAGFTVITDDGESYRYF
jgi:hypothetical protein